MPTSWASTAGAPPDSVTDRTRQSRSSAATRFPTSPCFAPPEQPRPRHGSATRTGCASGNSWWPSRQIITALLNDGRVVRAYLGVGTGPVPLPPQLARQLGRDTALALLFVEPGSPAALAGLREGDVLVAASGKPIMTSRNLQKLMLADAIGRTLQITVSRNGAMVDVIAVPRELDRF